MGDHRQRLIVAASLVMATSSVVGGISPALAAPITEQVVEPTNTPTSTPSQPSSAPPTPAFTQPDSVPFLRSESVESGPALNTVTLVELFNDLSFRQEDNSSPYAPALFEHWIDVDGDDCDTREEVLIKESLVPVTVGNGCSITGGQWYSWYDGATLTNPSDVDIDHLVPLQEAWQSGASKWTPELRESFANDLDFSPALGAFTDSIVQVKGSQDPATWIPSLEQCKYIAAWVSVKWRWNLTVDLEEQSVLNHVINVSTCGNSVVERPVRMATTFAGWPLYKIVYESTIYELTTHYDGSGQVPVPITYARWADFYKFKEPTPAATDFVKYPWSPTLYAVTFWPGGEDQWRWTQLSLQQWQAAGSPAPRNAGWIKGSYNYKWGSSSELFVQGADSVKHKLTYQEWAATGFRDYTQWNTERFVKRTWAPEIARISDYGDVRAIGSNEWREEAFPTPFAMQRIPGDNFYRDCASKTIRYSGPGMNRPINFQEWQGAGSPNPTVTGTC